MSRLLCSVVAAGLCVSLAAWLGGCPGSQGTTPEGTGGTGTSDDTQAATLTTAEKDAVMAGAKSAESLAQAVATAQSPTGAEEEGESSYDLPEFDRTLDFGVCPRVALTATSDGMLTFDMTVDFGDGCQPYGTTEFTCSGSASGLFDQAEKKLNMTFENISCEAAKLTGAVDVVYERLASAVNVEGTFDLTYVDDLGTILTNGTGNGSYDLTEYVTTIADFEGVVNGEDTYDTTLTDVKMCYPTYQRFMPFAGELQVAGSTIRTCIVRFAEESPRTGLVQVSIGGSPFVSVNLYAAE